MLRILHLSDIHFRKIEVETSQDPNFHLRNEILRDVAQLKKDVGSVHVVIISGDTAFAGHPDEFAFASQWLKELCEAAGCDLTSVFVCPGNHDVDRKTADSPIVQGLHDNIKRTEGDPTAVLGRYLIDPDTARALYESLRAYNEFALQFFCDLLPPERTRAKRDLKLNDGSTLRLWGLNTVLVSSSKDDENTLFVDPASLQITRHDGVVNAVVAHHALPWIKQKRALEDHLNDVAPIQIFGHVHTNRIGRDVKFLRLIAGAVQPERDEEGWEPGFNLIELWVDSDGERRRLRSRTHVRVWQIAPGQFRAKMDGQSSTFDHSIDLPSWSPPVLAGPVETVADTALRGDGEENGAVAMDTLRDVGLRFYQLSFSDKFEIAGRLKLLEDEDTGQPDFERFRRVFLRASERGLLGELMEAVQAHEAR